MTGFRLRMLTSAASAKGTNHETTQECTKPFPRPESEGPPGPPHLDRTAYPRPAWYSAPQRFPDCGRSSQHHQEVPRMKSAIRRIEKLEQRNMPARQTPFDRNLIERVEAGCRRVKTDREAHGMSDPSDEGLPTVRLHTALGIQLTIDILHDGRGRNHLRWLRDKQPHWSGPLVPKAKETRGRMADRRLESSMASPGSAKATMTSRNS